MSSSLGSATVYSRDKHSNMASAMCQVPSHSLSRGRNQVWALCFSSSFSTSLDKGRLVMRRASWGSPQLPCFSTQNLGLSSPASNHRPSFWAVVGDQSQNVRHFCTGNCGHSLPKIRPSPEMSSFQGGHGFLFQRRAKGLHICVVRCLQQGGAWRTYRLTLQL